MDELISLADRFAAEHANLQTKDDSAVLKKLRNAGAVFVGPYSAVAAGDYVAGPSHCLPTNTTALAYEINVINVNAMQEGRGKTR